MDSTHLVNLRKTWDAAMDNYAKMKSKFCELASHPEVSDQEILIAARALGRVRAGLKETQDRIRNSPKPKNHQRTLIGYYTIERILGTRL